MVYNAISRRCARRRRRRRRRCCLPLIMLSLSYLALPAVALPLFNIQALCSPPPPPASPLLSALSVSALCAPALVRRKHIYRYAYYVFIFLYSHIFPYLQGFIFRYVRVFLSVFVYLIVSAPCACEYLHFFYFSTFFLIIISYYFLFMFLLSIFTYVSFIYLIVSALCAPALVRRVHVNIYFFIFTTHSYKTISRCAAHPDFFIAL